MLACIGQENWVVITGITGEEKWEVIRGLLVLGGNKGSVVYGL